MASGKKKIGIALLVILVGMQFYRPDKNMQLETTLDDFLFSEKAPTNVVSLFKNSCYNCHSNFTDYYWYNNIAPASWYVDNHIKNAKASLNLSDWVVKDVRDKRAMLSAIAFDISEEKMPTSSYLILHRDAKLSEKEKKEIMNWLYTIEIN